MENIYIERLAKQGGLANVKVEENEIFWDIAYVALGFLAFSASLAAYEICGG